MADNSKLTDEERTEIREQFEQPKNIHYWTEASQKIATTTGLCCVLIGFAIIATLGRRVGGRIVINVLEGCCCPSFC